MATPSTMFFLTGIIKSPSELILVGEGQRKYMLHIISKTANKTFEIVCSCSLIRQVFS